MSETQTKRIGKYEIVSVMGRGAMGVIYRANDSALGRQVAIKTLSGVLPEDAELRLRFIREARSVGQLHHPNVVTVHEFFEEAGTAYLVMELLEGSSLFRLLRKDRSFPLEEKLSILLQIAAGTEAAHEHKIVHRDLKPSNVFIERSGVAKVLDFGVAKVGESGLTRAGTIFGTIEYMAPEQLRAQEVDARADVFSVGVLAYELFSGRNPFRAETPAASVFKLVSDDPESLTAAAGVARELDAIVRRALSKKREERFSTMAEFASALTQAALDLGVSPKLPTLSEAEVMTKAGASDAISLGGSEMHQWSNIAAAAGQLERLYREGIERFSAGDYKGCVERMGQVLDEAQVHSLSLHYLTQAEEKLRHQRLDPTRRREASGLLAYMRRAHQRGESTKVIETVGKVLALDPESMEARWYRRTAENRITPSRTRHAYLTQGPSFRSVAGVSLGKSDASLVAQPLPVSTPGSSLGFWYAAAAAALLLGVLGFAWAFSGARANGSTPKPTTRSASGSHVSIFDGMDDADAIAIELPQAATVTSVFPKELARGEESELLVSGKNFEPGAALVVVNKDPGAPGVEVLSATVANGGLIQARVRVAADAPVGAHRLRVEHPNGSRPAEFEIATK